MSREYLSNSVLEKLPYHLRDFILKQPYDSYTAQNQAVWRYVMRKNLDYLKSTAHESYISGLEKAGISTEEIPRMEKVMRNFILFRYTEITLIFLGVILMYGARQNSLWNGIGVGLFIQSSTVLLLDFFAERRGEVYLEYLKSMIDN